MVVSYIERYSTANYSETDNDKAIIIINKYIIQLYFL